MVDEIEASIRRHIPARYMEGILDNIGIPNSGISTSYSNNGLIGTGDADILISLREDHPPTDAYARELRLALNREFPGNVFYFLPADIVSQTLNFGIPAPLDIQITGRNQVKEPPGRGAVGRENEADSGGGGHSDSAARGFAEARVMRWTGPRRRK